MQARDVNFEGSKVYYGISVSKKNKCVLIIHCISIGSYPRRISFQEFSETRSFHTDSLNISRYFAKVQDYQNVTMKIVFCLFWNEI